MWDENYYLPFLIFVRVVFLPYERDDKLVPLFSYLSKSCLSFSICGMINNYLPFLIFVRVVFLSLYEG